MPATNLKLQIFELVNKIPEGKVTWFGRLAELVGSDARTVGWILSGMSKEEWNLIVWYRVVAKNGFISSLKLGEKGLVQKELLKKEGYFLIGDKVDMTKHAYSFGDDDNVKSLF